MKKISFRILTLFLAFTLLAVPMLLCSCEEDTGEVTKISFKSASSYDFLRKLDGKKVTINGYLATSSPVDGSSIFLMNLPFQSCPFCKPNTSQLSNTMKVYPKLGQKFSYTTQAVKVVGTLEVAANLSKPFTDEYGYEFGFKIVNAEYVVLRDEDMSSEIALWQKLASSEVINDIYKMYDYVDFLCKWPGYWIDTYTDSNGNEVTGYYLYASDAIYLITQDGGQYNYGYKDGYFDDLIREIRAVDDKAFEDLVKNVENARDLAQRAFYELESGRYTFENKYVPKFGKNDDIYKLNIGDELAAEMEKIYAEFAEWLGSWEL